MKLSTYKEIYLNINEKVANKSKTDYNYVTNSQ